MMLTDAQRKAIHDLALNARELLTRDAEENVLQRVYGLHPDGQLEPVTRLPQVQTDAETAETYRRLAQFLDDEQRAGLPRSEAVAKLIKEIAFTHLNRLVAFKMMEARRLIRGTIDKGQNSNGYKIYLVEVEGALHGDDASYRRFLLWQAGQIAQEIAVLFDPDTLASRLFPSPEALNTLIGWLNQPELTPCWEAEETIGWVYQFFNEREKADVFAALGNKQKIRQQDIPAATQLFTPNWIVRFLVQNTLGHTWVQMHPDTRLLDSDLLDYLVPLQGNVPAEPLRSVRDITLLDPACGTMHFGLVAFDLFAAMYQEELDRAGEPGWPETPSVSDPAEIASAIIAHNLYGIDIDLRAVQLSALALYLKAKSLNKHARITDSHLACADVLPLNGARLGTFLREMRFSPLIERLIRTLWERLRDANQFGSLLRLEREFKELLREYRDAPMLARIDAGFADVGEMEDAEFWELLFAQVIQGLDEFARRQAQDGADTRFFTGEAIKGLRLLDVLLRRYDVVVTNPPYSGKRNLKDTLAAFLDDQYPDTKGDLYAAFIERCAELLEAGGRLGMITQQSFMFLSSYEQMRRNLRAICAVEAMAHTGPRAFAEISGEKVNTTVFVLRADADPTQRENAVGTYLRLVNAPTGDGKRAALERALATGEQVYHVAQRKFDAIPGAPWAYWVSDTIRELFVSLPKLGDVAPPKHGMSTGNNVRFLRFWWEVGLKAVSKGFESRAQAQSSMRRWFPYMKGGGYRKWFGNQEYVLNYFHGGKEMLAGREDGSVGGHRHDNPDYYFREGVTWTDLGAVGFSARLSPGGFVFDVSGSSAFPSKKEEILHLLTTMNARTTHYLLSLLNPTIHFQVGDLRNLPIPLFSPQSSGVITRSCIWMAVSDSLGNETTYDFIAPLAWHTGLDDAAAAQARLADLERQIDDEVYKLYGISDDDRAAIEAELVGGSFAAEEDEAPESAPEDESAEEGPAAPLTREELAVRWISYAVGIVLGRFVPGEPGALGRAVYRRADFAVGSLPAPDEDEFNRLVGGPERFAYVDAEGGRHVFPAEVEAALRALAVPDGITVLDEGHPRDLPALVEQALVLMLGDAATDDVIRAGAGGDLRRFLSKDFFTGWHVKWYRKRPVYWYLQSARRSYGFVLFHERVERFTLYKLLRDYLDYRINRVTNAIADLQARRAGLSGRALKQLEKDIAELTAERDELNTFSTTMERIANDGYQPEPNWIDDGVILRLAPLWELIPIWKTEPRKYWEKLQAGECDWSHIAMRYWPDRVREKCRTNKSFAIAHGHEEWFGT